jgi:prepilin-type N-terminal cleavage/methylation domain-containing protein
VTAPTHGRRAGFTLIELLVVIGIMALLAAIAVGTYFRIQAGQYVKNTEATLAKINTQFGRLQRAVVDQAEKEFRERNLAPQPGGGVNNIDDLIALCGGDKDRAKSVWVYFRLKNEFPQTFVEANSNTVLYDTSNNTRFKLPPRRAFMANSYISAAVTPTPPPPPLPAPFTTVRQVLESQAAALLYLIVTEKGNRGEDFGDLATGSTAVDTTVYNGASTGTFRAFKDAWGTPIIYVRFATNTEINGSPYTKSGATSNDPLDPKGRLYYSGNAWPNPTAKPSDMTWPSGSQEKAFASSIFLGNYNGLNSINKNPWPNANWMLTAISGGANRDPANPNGSALFDSVDLTTNLLSSNPVGLYTVDTTTDDILGYRLRREGNRGD